MKNSYHLSPSLLSANFAKLGEEAKQVLAAGADSLHLDVMDNHYVPNLTVGPLVCHALRKEGITACIDVHLMARPVDRLIIEFAKAGANTIIIHPETTDHLDRSIQLILDHHCQAGIALNLSTPLNVLEYILDKISIILIMSVNPGFGGQVFLTNAFKKIQATRTLLTHMHSNASLAVDGGVSLENIRAIAKAGADRFIAGSAIFKTENYHETIAAFRKNLLEE